MVQLLLTFDPSLVEKVVTLLNDVMEDNPLLPRFFQTGAFFFIMMYTGFNILPIAKFLKYAHTKQSFRPDDVSCYGDGCCYGDDIYIPCVQSCEVLLVLE